MSTGTTATIPLPIPGDPALAGLDVYTQALGLNVSTTSLFATGGRSLGLGY